MPTPRLIPEIISAAIDGYGAQKIRIDDKIAELRAMLDGGAKPTAATPEFGGIHSGFSGLRGGDQRWPGLVAAGVSGTRSYESRYGRLARRAAVRRFVGPVA